MERKLLTKRSVLAEQRQVRVTASNEDLGRDGMVLITSGIELTNFRRNSVVLWQHCPDQPIARATTITPKGTDLEALIQFPPIGASTLADEIFALIQAEVIGAVSIGFEIIEQLPIDPKEPFGATRVTKSELQEISFVSIPALASALVSERAHRREVKPMPKRSMKFHKRHAKLYAAELAMNSKPAASPARRSKQDRQRIAARFAAEVGPAPEPIRPCSAAAEYAYQNGRSRGDYR